MSMPSFVDTTRIAIAAEDAWGDSRNDAAYRLLPLLGETLRPEMHYLNPQSLSGLAEVTPLSGTSLVSGEIEGIASTALLKTLLGYTLMADAVRDVNNWQSTLPIDGDGKSEIVSPPATLKAGDYIWFDPKPGRAKIETGFYPVSKIGNALYATGLPPNMRVARFGLRSRYGIIAAKGLKSFSLMRDFGEGNRWMRFSGMCVERLVLDAEEGSLVTVAASLIGKAMEEGLAAPENYTEPATAPAPLGIAEGFRSFSIGNDQKTLGNDDIALTGLRLVLERGGMAPRHVLGRHAPLAINPGRLRVYGHIDMLIGTHDLFAWLTAQNTLAISLVLQDTAVQNGVALSMQNVKLTGVEPLPRARDDLLAARFSFTADGGDAGASDVIRCSLHE